MSDHCNYTWLLRRVAVRSSYISNSARSHTRGTPRSGLHGNQLSGSIPTQIGRLVKLASLCVALRCLFPRPRAFAVDAIDCYRGSVRRTHPRSGCRSCPHLPPPTSHLSPHIFRRHAPSAICNAPPPHSLLDHNALEGSIPAEIGQLVNLPGLDLRGNALSGRVPSLNFSRYTSGCAIGGTGAAGNRYCAPLPPGASGCHAPHSAVQTCACTSSGICAP